MQPRIKNPALSVPGALEALQQLGASATTAGIPETTLYMVHLRASQINSCSVCVDIHTRELEHAGESSERIHTHTDGVSRISRLSPARRQVSQSARPARR